MAQAPHPRMHGLTHLTGGADPIPGFGTVPSGSGAGSYTERILAMPSLVAYWPMSDTGVPMVDLSGHGHPLSVEVDTPTYLQPGPMPDSAYPYSVKFDGPNGIGGFEPEYVGTASDAAFSFSGTSAFTFECLAYPTSLPVTLAPMFGVIGGSSQFVFGLQGTLYAPNDGKAVLYHGTSQLGTAVLNLNEWTHVAATYDGATIRLYFDAAAVGSGANTDSIAAGSKQIRIGGYEFPGSGTKCSWQGRIAHAAVYNTALTAAELAGHVAGVDAAANEPAGYVLTSDGSGGSSWEPSTIEVDY